MAVCEANNELEHVAGSSFLTDRLDDFERNGYIQQEHAMREAADGGSFEVPAAEYPVSATARGHLNRYAARLDDLVREGWLLVPDAPLPDAKASERFTEGDA